MLNNNRKEQLFTKNMENLFKKKFDQLICYNSSKSTSLNPFQPSVAFHVEIGHLFRRAKQMTGFDE